MAGEGGILSNPLMDAHKGGEAGVRYRGVWDAGMAYEPGDVVFGLGTAYDVTVWLAVERSVGVKPFDIGLDRVGAFLGVPYFGGHFTSHIASVDYQNHVARVVFGLLEAGTVEVKTVVSPGASLDSGLNVLSSAGSGVAGGVPFIAGSDDGDGSIAPLAVESGFYQIQFDNNNEEETDLEMWLELTDGAVLWDKVTWVQLPGGVS